MWRGGAGGGGRRGGGRGARGPGGGPGGGGGRRAPAASRGPGGGGGSWDGWGVRPGGASPTLEDQMCGFSAALARDALGHPPARVDALVGALTELMLEPGGPGLLDYYARLVREQREEK